MGKAKIILDNEIDDRYGILWRQISIKAKQMCPVCCICQRRPSKVSHHVQYVEEPTIASSKLLLDDLILGVHLFPLCSECHHYVHRDINYIQKPNRHFNRNTIQIKNLLKSGYSIQYGSQTHVLKSLISVKKTIECDKSKHSNGTFLF